MASALRRTFGMAVPAVLVGSLALTPSFATAQQASAARSTITAPSKPANDVPAPSWVREPIGGPNSGKFLRVADTRGQGAPFAALVALGASDKNAVILLVQGDNPGVIKDAKLELSMQVLNGYDRVGLVLANGPPDTAYIYSKGHKIITMTNLVTAEDRAVGFAQDLKRIYERDVVPVLGNGGGGQQSSNGVNRSGSMVAASTPRP